MPFFVQWQPITSEFAGVSTLGIILIKIYTCNRQCKLMVFSVYLYVMNVHLRAHEHSCFCVY
jgi:hypothetical protein